MKKRVLAGVLAFLCMLTSISLPEAVFAENSASELETQATEETWDVNIQLGTETKSLFEVVDMPYRKSVVEASGATWSDTDVFTFTDTSLNVGWGSQFPNKSLKTYTMQTGDGDALYTLKPNVNFQWRTLTPLLKLKDSIGGLRKFEVTLEALNLRNFFVTSYTNNVLFEGVSLDKASAWILTRELNADGTTVALDYKGQAYYSDPECTQKNTTSLGNGPYALTGELQVDESTGEFVYLYRISDASGEVRYFRLNADKPLADIMFGQIYPDKSGAPKYYGLKLKSLASEFQEIESYASLSKEELLLWEKIISDNPESYDSKMLEAFRSALDDVRYAEFAELTEEIPDNRDTSNEALAQYLGFVSECEAVWSNIYYPDNYTDRDEYIEYTAFVAWLEKAVADANAEVKNGAMQTFESGDLSLFSLTEGSDASFSLVDNIDKDNPINTSNKVVAFQRKSDGDHILLLNDQYVDGTLPLRTFRAKLYLSSVSTSPYIIYSYVDDSNYSAIGFTDDMGVYHWKMVDGAITNASRYISTYPVVQNSTDFQKDKNCWIDVVIEYSIATVTVRLNTYNGVARTAGHEFTLSGSYATRVGFGLPKQKNATSRKDKPMYIDDVSFTFLGEDTQTAMNYQKNYQDVLLLRAANAASIDKERVDEAIRIFHGYSDGVKYALPLIEEQLNELHSVYANDLHCKMNMDAFTEEEKIQYWQTNNTYSIGTNFSNVNDLGLFLDYDRDIGEQFTYTLGTSPEIVDTGLDEYGNALRLHTVELTLKDSILPEKAVSSVVEYDIWLDEMYKGKSSLDTNPIRIMMGSGSWMGLELDTWKDVYEKRGDVLIANRSTEFDWFSPIHVKLTYPKTTAKTATMYLSQTYLDDEGKECTASYNLSFSVAATMPFYIGAAHKYVYVDNLAVTYVKGDFDIDETTNDIVVTYSGNTFVDGGDIVTVQGPNFYQTVSSVAVQKIEDVGDTDGQQLISERGFVEVHRWDMHYDIPDGTYSRDVSDYTWDDTYDANPTDANNPYYVSIVQRTEDSIKFEVPDDYGSGIFAVKLYGSNGLSDNDDLVIYLNAPHIEYAVGDEGDFAVAGGTFQIVGKNIAPNYESETEKNDDFKVLLVGEDGAYCEELTIAEIKSEYSVVVNVPTDVKVGEEYELWLYNGYGDGSCWSIPEKVKIGEDIRTGWKKKFINFKEEFDYTNMNQDATPYFVEALEMLYQAGGGTLYLPEGTYRLTQPLAIPENVIITGESLEKTYITFSGWRWQENELPSHVFNVTSNVEISNISFYARRFDGFLKFFCLEDGQNATSENVYLENIRFEKQLTMGSASGGNSWYDNILDDGKAALQTEVYSGYFITKNSMENSPTKNVQIENFDTNEARIYIEWRAATINEYWQIRNFSRITRWSTCNVSNSIIEGYESEGVANSLGGYNCYIDDAYLHDNIKNNRELMVDDEGWKGSFKGLEETDNKYQYYANNSYTQEYQWLYVTFEIAKGQGAGQTRRVVNAEFIEEVDGVNKWLLTFDSPFTISPNRNSSVTMRTLREHNIYTDSYLYNGAAGFGYYGGCVDYISDDNVFDRVGYQIAENQGWNMLWYWSYVNNTNIYDPYHAHNGIWKAGISIMSTLDGRGGARGLLFRDNDLSGRGISVTVSGNNAEVADMVFQNNYFTGQAFNGGLSTSIPGIDGALIYENYYTDVSEPYAAHWLTRTKQVDSIGRPRLLILDELPDTELSGDVNLDGCVDLKDVTMTRYYVIGKVELSEAQITNGDLDLDGALTVKDAVLIREQILNNL